MVHRASSQGVVPTPWLAQNPSCDSVERDIATSVEAASESVTDGLGAAQILAPHVTRILVVDDDQWIRDLLERILVRNGYEVCTVASAVEALQSLRHTPFDLLISDMMLGGMTGLELTSRVSYTRPDLPIVLITAHGHTDLMRVALRQGAIDFIAKPFNIETIPIIIERNLERRTLERQKVLEHEDKVMFKTIQALIAAVDAKEPFTAQHSRRVAALSAHLAQSMRLPKSEQRFLQLAAYVHDVGKIGTPDHILNKSGPLDDEEWESMRKHAAKGADIVSHVEELTYVADIVRHHHERVDGSGYPDGLSGESIPFLSRMIAVADAYEVMTSDRVYRTRMPSEVAIRRLFESAGTQFDTTVVEAFAHMQPDSLPLE